MYLSRAIDSNGATVEFWFSERRNLTAASDSCARRSSGTVAPSGL